MGLIQLLFKDPTAFVILSVLLLYSVIFHELAHGWIAYKMGDPTAKWLGRLTLNPAKHVDPFGTVMLLVVGFGWAKPVPVNLENIPSADRRKGLILVSAAGVTANIIIAFSALLFYRLMAPSPSGIMTEVLFLLAKINLILAAFNLIPIPPLDGSKILMGFAPESLTRTFNQIEPYGFFIVLGLLLIGALNPVINFFQYLILALISVFLPG
ncbi:MAG TPA: site-2 protease family protein [Smithella sp.]|nr:site-2 protease family protein [Smithella sp.]MDM7987890.1 site-2 protease family protein [Smithella sp.]HNY50687.1 site-2 protease family protein [Smithella sp.]HOG89142.1 site-2 protease family protein [Smithella sp.]HOU50267.1 site-2 protease family protein [Smithella sp.]